MEAPAGPAAVEAPASQPASQQQRQQRQQQHVSISPVTTASDKQNAISNATPTEPKPQQQQQQQNPSKPSTAVLASVDTSQGPIVMSTPEEAAQAQQALRLLNTYDFKIYGQGLSAGPSAEPLEPPGQKVLYKPDPVAPEPPLPPSITAAADPGDRRQETSAAAAGSRDRGLGTTPSGTPTVFMKPLPAEAAATNSRAAGAGVSPAAVVAAPGNEGQSERAGPVCMTLDQKLQQQQQNIQPSVIRRRKQQQPYYPSAAGPNRRVVAAVEHHTSAGSSSSSSRRGRVRMWWDRTKTAVCEAVEDAAAWLVHMLYLLTMWLLKILMIPLRAVFGPWYRFNRCGISWGDPDL